MTVLHDDGTDRRWRMCLCSTCGAVEMCTPVSDFYARVAGGPLQCTPCFDEQNWDDALDEQEAQAARARRIPNESEMHQRRRRRSMLEAFGLHGAAAARLRELTGRAPGVEAPLP